MLLNKYYYLLLLLFFFPLADANSNNIVANYEITWNNILLGNISWHYLINPPNYEFKIKLESSGVASKLYYFQGDYYSRGGFVNKKFISKEYSQNWNTKTKSRFIKIIFGQNKIKSLIMRPKEIDKPFVNYLKLYSPIDPISASLELILNDDRQVIRNVFDGRRVYSLSTTSKTIAKNKWDHFVKIKKYNLRIDEYKNIWKNHNKRDLKRISVVTGNTLNGMRLPLNFKIVTKGLVLKINYLNHEEVN